LNKKNEPAIPEPRRERRAAEAPVAAALVAVTVICAAVVVADAAMAVATVPVLVVAVAVAVAVAASLVSAAASARRCAAVTSSARALFQGVLRTGPARRSALLDLACPPLGEALGMQPDRATPKAPKDWALALVARLDAIDAVAFPEPAEPGAAKGGVAE
jgi:hypothetical protein